MKKVFSALPDNIYLSQVNIPGTHDSCTAFCTMENMSRCQSLSVKEQLDLGIRLFDIRLNKSGNDFYLVHALSDCFTDNDKKRKLTFDMVLDDFRAFLKENPDETLVVSIKQDRGIMNRFFFPSFYEKYINGNKHEWYLENEIPTLSFCRGKMVLMRRCKVFSRWESNNKCGLDFSHWKDQDGKRKTHPLPVHLNKETVATVQDRYGIPAEKKWKECALPALENTVTDKNRFAVHFLSTANRQSGKTLSDTAEKVNSEFMNYELSKEKAYGFMLFDFPSCALVDKIINSNFEIYKEKIK